MYNKAMSFMCIFLLNIMNNLYPKKYQTTRNPNFIVTIYSMNPWRTHHLHRYDSVKWSFVREVDYHTRENTTEGPSPLAVTSTSVNYPSYHHSEFNFSRTKFHLVLFSLCENFYNYVKRVTSPSNFPSVISRESPSELFLIFFFLSRSIIKSAIFILCNLTKGRSFLFHSLFFTPTTSKRARTQDDGGGAGCSIHDADLRER